MSSNLFGCDKKEGPEISDWRWIEAMSLGW
jgi:hypothetical protein